MQSVITIISVVLIRDPMTDALAALSAPNPSPCHSAGSEVEEKAISVVYERESSSPGSIPATPICQG